MDLTRRRDFFWSAASSTPAMASTRREAVRSLCTSLGAESPDKLCNDLPSSRNAFRTRSSSSDIRLQDSSVAGQVGKRSYANDRKTRVEVNRSDFTRVDATN